MENERNIYQKLIEIRKAVPYLRKENEGYQFKYVSSSQALSAIRDAMDKEGVLLVPTILEKTLQREVGGKQWMTELLIQFEWVNTANPQEKITCKWYGQGLDTGEKGVGKALTYAEKYFILKSFNIPTDTDDPDSIQEKPELIKHTPTEKVNPDGSKEIIYSVAGGCTDKQQKAIWAIFKKKGMSDDEIHEKVGADYGVEHLSELTKQQASEIIDLYGGDYGAQTKG